MKKLSSIIALLLGIVAMFSIAGCGSGTQSGLQNDSENKIDEMDTKESVGTFYTLHEAYDNGWITQSDLMSIAYYHNDGRAHNEDIMSEDYMPSPKMPEILSGSTELKIKNTAAKDFNEKNNITYAEAEGFKITDYCGTYGDCVAIMLTDDYSGTTGVEWTDSVAGINIYYNSGREIQIWRDTIRLQK